MIQNAHNENVFRPNFQTQNMQFKNLIYNINSKVQQKNRRFDIVEISSKARQLLKSEIENSDKIIDYENSPVNGKRSQAQWAESSLTQQRNGVASTKGVLEYQKERLENILSKISEYEKIANGEISQNNTLISKERAENLMVRYKESIKTDFSKEIEDIVSFYNDWVKAYDKYSKGLSSKVMDNVLETISAQSLGLDNLCDDPTEIMKALDNAIVKLTSTAKSIEDKFFQATGKEKEMLEYDSSDIRKNSAVWRERKIELESAFIERVSVDNTVFTGVNFQIDDLL